MTKYDCYRVGCRCAGKVLKCAEMKEQCPLDKEKKDERVLQEH